MGPWCHAIGRQPVGELTFCDARPPAKYDAGLWFQHYLLGVDNGIEKLPAVSYYVMGDTQDPQAPGNQWRQANDWPVPSRPVAYYFSTNGLLSAKEPAQENASLTYTFDPADPCPTVGGNNLTIPAGPRNQNQIESRKDVLLFTTPPLAEPLEVTGHVAAKVFLVSSAVDTDLCVRLCDVYPEGKSYNMAEGMLRLRFRNGFEKPQPLLPGALTEVTIDCWSTSIVFNRGHRLRVAVTSSNAPRFDVNPGTGKPWQEGDPHVKQTNRIQMDAAHASCIILPVVN
jgi:putative CocE/NonD family hydrolase